MMVKLQKIIIVLGIIAALVVPMVFIIVPSWSKVSGLLNMVSVLDDPSGLGLSSFSFVERDDDTVTLVLKLSIDNTESADELVFPAMNISLNFGADPLGSGWVDQMVVIPAGTEGEVSIWARMIRGEAFVKFFLSAVAGGLSLSIGTTDIFAFLDTFGGIENVGGLMLSLEEGIAMPSLDLGGDLSAFNPKILDLERTSTANLTQFEINLTDKGNGMEKVLLNYSIGADPWQQIEMEGLPRRAAWGGNDQFLGSLFFGDSGSLANYTKSSIACNWLEVPLTASLNITGLAAGTSIKYQVIAIDVVGNTLVIPSETVLEESDPTDDTGNGYYSFDVSAGNSSYWATWINRSAGTGDGEAEAGLDLMAILESTGTSIDTILFEGSEVLQPLTELLSFEGEINATELLGQINTLIQELEPLVEYLERRDVNLWEMMDQMMGISGGSPIFVELEQDFFGYALPADLNWTDNVNSTLAFDMLTEGGVSLLTLIDMLKVNFTKVVDQIVEGFTLPIRDDETPGQSMKRMTLEYLENMTEIERNDYFDNDLSNYKEFPIHVLYENNTGSVPIYTNYSMEAANESTLNDVLLGGDVGDLIYFGNGSMSGDGIFDGIKIEMGNETNNGSMELEWQYYDNDTLSWTPITGDGIVDGTNNFSQSGRIIFNITQAIGKVVVNGTEASWYRVNITNNSVDLKPVASAVVETTLRIPYKLRYEDTDTLGRPTKAKYADEIQTLQDCWDNKDNGTHFGILTGIMGQEGYNYGYFVDHYGETYFTAPTPVSAEDIISAQSVMMGMIMYILLLVTIYAASSGVENKYQFSKDKVSKWFDENTRKPGKKEEI